MQLGIVITDESLGPDALAVMKASYARGWGNRCFLTDRGVLMLREEGFCQLMHEHELEVAVCELSMQRYAHPAPAEADLMAHVVVGGQYQNAQLVHNSDRVLVF